MAGTRLPLAIVAALCASALLAQPAANDGYATASTDEARQALRAAEASSADAAGRASRLEAAATAALNDADAVRARAAAIAARIQTAEADINAAEAQIAIIDTLRREQRARLAEKQGPTVRLVAALQMLARRPAALSLVQPGSIDDLVHIRAVFSTVAPAIEARTAALRGDVARGKALAAEADKALAALNAGQQALVAQRTALAALETERRRTADRLTGNALSEQDRAMALGEDARDLGDLMARIGASAAVRARLESLPGPILRPQRPGDPRPPPLDTINNGGGQAPYRLPVIGQVVTGFGEISSAGVRARGLTIATRAGAQVVAPTGGRIVYASGYRGYGNIVIIDHGRGWTTLITGLAILDARVGESVDQGSPIGKAGPARPTITVELRNGGAPIDIARLIG